MAAYKFDNIAPGRYIVTKVEYGLQLHFKMFPNKSDRKKTTTKNVKMLINLDFNTTSGEFSEKTRFSGELKKYR